MKIKELQDGSRKVVLEAKITSIEQPREVNTKNGPTNEKIFSF